MKPIEIFQLALNELDDWINTDSSNEFNLPLKNKIGVDRYINVKAVMDEEDDEIRITMLSYYEYGLNGLEADKIGELLLNQFKTVINQITSSPRFDTSPCKISNADIINGSISTKVSMIYVDYTGSFSDEMDEDEDEEKILIHEFRQLSNMKLIILGMLKDILTTLALLGQTQLKYLSPIVDACKDMIKRDEHNEQSQ